ncbi:MAG: 30S ribosomal protein S9 [Candidatus Omnitrophota bacterium]|jgi:small subunit ribosomal protein S9|nr:MAG: 30S ribosomal protein S9 [Candidatus Omnitrophota bacterium]
MEAATQSKALGRRKEAIARVRVMPGSGRISVNGKDFSEYFIRETDRIIIKQPLMATNTLDKYDIFANLSGGGLTGQAGALRLGISRILASFDPSFKDLLRKQGFITRDPRMKERKKYGRKGARKRFQWTKR